MFSNKSHSSWASPKKKPFSSIFRGCGALLEFLYPHLCYVCDEPAGSAEYICDKCGQKLETLKRPTVHRRNSDFPYLDEKLFFNEVFTGWTYSQELEILLHRFKYEEAGRLAVWMGRQLGSLFCEQLRFEDTVLVPVPLHSVRHRERGYNQSEMICRGIAGITQLPIDRKLLSRVRDTRSQTKLSAAERQENVHQAFRIQGIIPVNQTIILVDDVVTTGATLNSCAKLLSLEGVRRIAGVAIVRPVFRDC